MEREQVLDLIKQSLVYVAPTAADGFTENTRLIGGNSSLDSTTLVSLVVEIEQQIEERFGRSVTIADDRALSQERSPFRTAGSLAEYVVRLCDDNAGAARE